jgi:hypothetical protein
LETSGGVCRGSYYFLFYFPSILKKYAIYGFEHTCNKGVREFQWKFTLSLKTEKIKYQLFHKPYIAR